jgi:hypothetical protein
MTRRYTQKNKSGVRGKSTLLTGLDKMKKIRKDATAKQKIGGQSNLEKSLNDMAKWLVAVTKCPARHYGKVWNDEKEVIVRQAQALYEEMQKFVTYQNHSFMGNQTDKAGRSDRFIPLSRLRYNVATAKWDFTNSMEVERNQYWNDKANVPGKVKIISDQNEKSWALNHLSQGLMVPEEDTRRAYTQKVTQTYAEWRLASGLI